MVPTRLRFIAALAVLVSVSAAPAQWIELKSARYSILYQPGGTGDAQFVRGWLDRAEGLMKVKYGVTSDRYFVTFYLHPAPTENADTNKALSRCCSLDAHGIIIGTIDYLAPSARAWTEKPMMSSLGLPKDDLDYHAKVITSEYIPIGHYAVQASRPSGGWHYYSAPEWFTQGLQEYDAIFHTTESNRTATAARLIEWATKNRSQFACCRSGITIGDLYNGGATFMVFLAADFGEDVHARLLRSSAETFQTALLDVAKPYTIRELFDRFLAWLDKAAVAAASGPS